ncbi:MAG: sulfatase-like hydrolase/transferase [Planctomycetaceae bacterium]
MPSLPSPARTSAARVRSGRRDLMATLFTGLCLTACTFADEPGKSPRPNVLLILVDDLGYGDLGCYGATDLRTPNVDRLMSEGLRLDEFYANCPVCSPTRAALLSGRYQDMVGVPGVIRTSPQDNWGYLHPAAVLLPAVLREAGYHTSIVGTWHLGLEAPNRPTDRGFDQFRGFLGDMMDDYYEHRRHGINYMRQGEQEIDPEGHATDLFTTWACDYLRERAGTPRQPFFLYLAYNAPHTPIQPPDDWLRKVRDREPGLSEKRAKLVALIEHLDDGIGRVLNCLAATGQSRDTIVIFTSDNGGQLDVGASNGRLRDGKQSVYEGGLKVCTCIRWPGTIEPGRRSDFRAMSMDLLPTVCEAAEIAIPHEVDGRSLLPTCRGESQPPLRELWFFRRREGGIRYGGKTIEAVRRGDWKLLQNSPYAPLELYNLRDDPGEERDLSRAAPKVLNELAAELRREIQRYGQVPWQAP